MKKTEVFLRDTPLYGTDPRPFDPTKSLIWLVLIGGGLFSIKNDYDFIGFKKLYLSAFARVPYRGVLVWGYLSQRIAICMANQRCASLHFVGLSNHYAYLEIHVVLNPDYLR